MVLEFRGVQPIPGSLQRSAGLPTTSFTMAPLCATGRRSASSSSPDPPEPVTEGVGVVRNMLFSTDGSDVAMAAGTPAVEVERRFSSKIVVLLPRASLGD